MLKTGSATAGSPRIAVPVALHALHASWQEVRRGKQPSMNQLAFEARWLDSLLHLQATLQAGDWQPARTVSFVVDRPKTREIHAPDFADRVVHQWLVSQLEPLFEPYFIHDSYANRHGKGSHAAVDRLQQFVRSRNGRGWYLQLDIHNCFNTIHRPTLYRMLCQGLGRAVAHSGLDAASALALRSLCHKLLCKPVAERMLNHAQAAALPPHKRLANALAHCGIAVGNLSSQFFANVYLHALDQFVKHDLKVKHYLRYVDDFVLLADQAAQLLEWRRAVEGFVQSTLHLRLKLAAQPQPLSQGIDFLGYRVYCTHRGVRPRVVTHCDQALNAWAADRVQAEARGMRLRAGSAELQQLRNMLASYWGHFGHANSVRLRHAVWQRHAWLGLLFYINAAGVLQPRWVLQGETFARQRDAMVAAYPQTTWCVQRGNRFFAWAVGAPVRAMHPEKLRHQLEQWRAHGQPYVLATQTGWLRHGTRRREIVEWFCPPNPLAGGAGEPVRSEMADLIL